MKRRDVIPTAHPRSPQRPAGRRAASRRLSVLAVALALFGAAHAAPVDIDLPAQPLAASLQALGRKAGLTIASDDALLAGKAAPALRGKLEPDVALRQLLAGSGLEAVLQNGAWLVRRAAVAAAQPESTLPEIRVRASAEAQPGDLPKAYAGGQVARGGGVGFLGNKDVFETPFNVTNFTAASIQNLQATRVEEVLKTDPAVRVASVGTGWYQDFIIRGFRVTGSASLFNGLAGIYPQYSQLFTQGIERVEVFKGANSLLAGVGSGLSIGGTVNLVPKRAGDAPLTQLTTEYSQDSRFGAQLDVGLRFGADNQLGVRVNGYASNGTTTIEDERDKLGFTSAALDFRGESTRLFLDFGRARQNSQASLASIAADPGVVIPAPPRRGSNYQQPFAFSDTAYNFQMLRGEWDIAKDVMGYASYGASQAKYKQILPFALLHDSAGNIDEVFQNGSGIEHYRAWNIGLNAKFSTGPAEHQIALTATRNWSESGGSYVFDEASGSQATVASNLYNPVRVALRPDILFPAPVAANGNDNASQAIADTLSLWNRQLQLTVGVRRQRISYRSLGPGSDPGYSETALTPAVAAIVKLNPVLSVYGNYIESLEGGPSAPSTAVNRDQVFPPSKDKQRELGIKLDFGSLGMTSSVYEIDQPSGILDPATNVFNLDGRRLNRGLEFNVFGEPVKGLRLQGGFVVSQAKLRKTENGTYDGRNAAGVARNNIALSGEWDAPFAPGLTLTANLNRSGPVYLDLENTRQIEAFTETGLGLRYATTLATTPVTIRGALSNAFNSNHWVADVYGSFFQSAPRTLRVSATFDF